MLAIRKKHGPEAMALFTHGFGGSWFKHLFKSYGSPNIAAPSYAQCRGPREVGYSLTFGQGVGSPEAIDTENARCITLIGNHLGENMHNTTVQDLARAIERGADLIVVDPRFSVAASKAKYWLPIKPGTDIALLLAWINVLIEEERYDKSYVDKHTKGFAELKAHVADKTPDWAYPLTGIEPELIRRSARAMAAARPASLIHPGRHATWYGDDTQRVRAMAILSALLGSWGRRGGFILPSNMSLPPYPGPKYAHTDTARADRGASSYPLADETLASGLCDATITPQAAYDLHGWMVYGTNLIQSLPDARRTIKAIQKLDFLVVVEVLPVEIAGWADVVLPECTYLERDDDLWNPYYKQPFIAMRQEVVRPMYASKPGWWIARELGKRLGLADFFAYPSAAEYSKKRIELGGYDYDKLRRDGVLLGKTTPVCEEEGLGLSFDTESKKIELYSEPLKKLGFHPIPEFVPPQEPPFGMFRLLFGRTPAHTFGRTTNNRFLSEVYAENELWINADAARRIPGFEDEPLKTGQRVVLVNQDGVKSQPIRARVTQAIRGDCVYMVHGYGHTAKGLRFAHGRGAADNRMVTRFKVDPIMGGTGMNVNFVRVEKAEAAA